MYNKYSLKDKKFSFSDIINAPKAITEPFIKLMAKIVDVICSACGKGVDWLAGLFNKTSKENKEAVKQQVDAVVNSVNDPLTQIFGNEQLAQTINDIASGSNVASASSGSKEQAVYTSDGATVAQAAAISVDDLPSFIGEPQVS